MRIYIDLLSHIHICWMYKKYRMELIDERYDKDHRARYMADKKEVHILILVSYENIIWICNVLSCDFV